jgi:hypothetical protein
VCGVSWCAVHDPRVRPCTGARADANQR